MKVEERKTLTFSGIYLIKNIISGHCYIGQAKYISKRIYEHLRSTFDDRRSDYNSPLHQAIRKYGLDAFELEVLERCDNSQLNAKEQYWISIYNSKKNGYNQTNGGYQSIRYIKLTEENLKNLRQLLSENILSNVELAHKFNISEDMVARINVGKMWHNDSIKYPIRPTKNKLATNHFNGKAIKKLDLNNQIVKIYPSLSSAAKEISVDKSDSIAGAISRCCNGINKTAYGYKWQVFEISKEDWLKLFEN